MLTSVPLEVSHLSWRGWVVVKGVGVMRENEVEGGRQRFRGSKQFRCEIVHTHTHHTHLAL